MKKSFIAIVCLFSISSFSQSLADAGFELSYSYAGMGSNTGNWFPGFIVKGNQFTYQVEQNSCYSGETAPPEEKLSGTLSEETMQNLATIFNALPDTSIYATNVSVMSGGVHTIVLASPVKMIKFTLHNEWHPTAQQIVDLLNEYIPEEYARLWLFEDVNHKN